MLAQGREAASRLLRLCDPLNTPEDVVAAAYWLQVGSSLSESIIIPSLPCLHISLLRQEDYIGT